jgi:GNAT superfamily N-acetyltransferase
MGWIEVWQQVGWKGWDESQVWLFPAYRGQGLSKLLYKAIIDIDQQILYSGCSHTKYTKHLWESFVRKNTYTIHAHDLVSLRRYCDVVWIKDDGELYSALPLYGDIANKGARKIKQDIRLVAVKKGSV